MKDMSSRLGIFLLILKCVTGLIIPEELPTILSLVYSNIPPIRKGTDSRLGLGFNLGEHADFQIVMEIGPQVETEPIGNSDESKIRRAIILDSAMRGEMGPLAQSVAKYQIQRKLQMKKGYEQDEKNYKGFEKNVQNGANNWLSKWSKDQSPGSGNPPNIARLKVVEKVPVSNSKAEDTGAIINVFKELYENENRTLTAKKS